MSDPISLAMSIPGMITEACCKYLYELAQTSGDLVEIGCYKGRSTAIILQAANLHSGHVSTVDCFVPTEHAEAATPEEWRKNLLELGLELPILYQMASEEAAAMIRKPLDFIFIDSLHSYEQVSNDLRLWSPKVKIGGTMAIHDYKSRTHTGVTRAVDDWLTSDWDVIGKKGLVLGLRKVAE
jgi:predicted O-methyltransferase YrrM